MGLTITQDQSTFVKMEKTVIEMVTGCLRMIISSYICMQITKIGF